MDNALQVSPEKVKALAESTSLVQETITTFEHMRNDTVRAMQLLFAVKQTDAWQDKAATWGEFVEQDLGVSQSYASKLLTTWDHYVIKGGVSPKALEGTDYERLYLARQLPGSVEHQMNTAKTLSRRDIKATRNEDLDHEHVAVQITICKGCGMRIYGDS